MKKIIFLVTMILFSISQVDAGLFEYHMNGTLDNYVKYTKQAGVVEQLANETQATYSYDLKKTGGYINTPSPIYKKIDSYTQYNNFYNTNGYYKNNDFQNMLQNERQNYKSEKDYITKRETEIVQQLNNIRRENSQYYNSLRYNLERERDYNSQRKNDLTQMISKIETELREYSYNDTKSSQFYYNDYGQRIYFDNSTNNYDNIYYRTNYTNAYYYCYDGACYSYDASTNGNLTYKTVTNSKTSYSTYNNYSNTNYNNSSAYNNSSYNNYNSNYNSYCTESNSRYQASCYDRYYSQPSWVNPNLQAVKEGRIYIK